MMEPYLALFGVVGLAFASTNMDNLLLLVGWQLDGRLGPRRLFSGYLIGMLGVLALAILIGLVGYLIPLEYLGYLGVVPILVGARALLANLGSATGGPQEAPAGATVAAVAAIQLSNGVDTIVVFAPLLADSQLIFDLEIAILFILSVLIWFALARVMGSRAARLAVLNRVGQWLTPLVMIGVGLYILSNTATDLS